MRVLGTVVVLALAAAAAATLAEPADPGKVEKPSYRQLVEKLGAWTKEQEDADLLAEKDLTALRELVTALEKLGARELYEGLSPAERKALRELLDKEARIEGYATRVDRIAEDVGLSLEDTETLLELYTAYGEELQAAGWGDREKRDAAWDSFEKALIKAFGRTKARAIANAIRRAPRRGR